MATESPGTLCHAEVLAQAGYSISCYLSPFVKVKGIDLSLAGMMREISGPLQPSGTEAGSPNKVMVFSLTKGCPAHPNFSRMSWF